MPIIRDGVVEGACGVSGAPLSRTKTAPAPASRSCRSSSELLPGVRATAATRYVPITYFPSLRETWLFLVSAVRALDTDFSAD
jgi:hypothetical protein